jgi:hypothetical protein
MVFLPFAVKIKTYFHHLKIEQSSSIWIENSPPAVASLGWLWDGQVLEETNGYT